MITSIVFPLTVMPNNFKRIFQSIPPTDDKILLKHNFMKISIFY